MMNSRANVPPYNPHVLIGNWYEDRVMEEEVLSDFLHKRANGLLSSQKLTEVERMSQALPLSISAGDGLLRFGHQVLLVNTWTHAAKFTGEKSQLACCLTTGIAHTASTNGGTNEVTATGTSTIRSVLRSVFVIRRPNQAIDSQPVRYGDEIMLHDTTGQLFLTCIKSSSRAGRTCDVVFTDKPARNSVWIVMHPSIHLRMELDGSEIKIDDKVVLAHASSNTCLSVNEECVNKSPYGSEYELICELSTASLASYKSPIIWKFQTQSAYP